MLWDFIQANGSEELGSDANIAHAYVNNNAGGNMLVAGFSWVPSSAVVTSVVDSQGNTWVPVPVGSPLAISAGIYGMAMYYALNCAAGPNTVTVTWSVPVTNKALACAEYNGPAHVASFDVSVGQEQDGVPPATGIDGITTGLSASPTTQPNALIVVMLTHLVAGEAVSAGTGFTLRGGGPIIAEGAGAYDMFLEDKNLSVPGTFAGTFSQSVNRSVGTIAAAFRLPSSGGMAWLPQIQSQSRRQSVVVQTGNI